MLISRVPAPGLVLVGIISVQVGAGLAKQLFDQLPPVAVVTLRLVTAAVVMALIARPFLLRLVRRDRTTGRRGAGLDRRHVWAIVGLAVSLLVMNVAIYESFARIPLGIAVTIEFLGPLGLAVALSRRRLDLLWVGLAAIGVLLLATGESGSVTLDGVLLALLAGVAWAGYILCSARVGSLLPGTSGLAAASLLAAVLVAPVGISQGGTGLLEPGVLLVGLGIGLLSSVIPYSLELEALRRMPAKVFGIFMSLEPAAAALVGLLILGEVLALPEWVALGCIVLASVGSTRTSRARPQAPEA